MDCGVFLREIEIVGVIGEKELQLSLEQTDAQTCRVPAGCQVKFPVIAGDPRGKRLLQLQTDKQLAVAGAAVHGGVFVSADRDDMKGSVRQRAE